VILFFYPHDFTLVCPTEICSFNDSISTFEKLNTVIIGASTDSMFVHRAYALKPRKEGGLSPLTIPLISDITHSISKEYGCYINKGPHEGATVRATYIIDPKGILRHISMNDLNVGRSIDEIKRLVEAFQFTDEYGDVCPMNWKPGKRTMKGDLDSPELKKYFEEQLGKENN
jgi:alkyl hydroperoxide reductase subunit AhpC